MKTYTNLISASLALALSHATRLTNTSLAKAALRENVGGINLETEGTFNLAEPNQGLNLIIEEDDRHNVPGARPSNFSYLFRPEPGTGQDHDLEEEDLIRGNDIQRIYEVQQANRAMMEASKSAPPSRSQRTRPSEGYYMGGQQHYQPPSPYYERESQSWRKPNAPSNVKKPVSKKPQAIQLEAKLLEAKKFEAKKQEAKKLEAKRLEVEKLEAKNLEAKRLESERQKAKKLEAERQAKKLEAERQAKRLEAQRQAKKLEAERQVKRLKVKRLESRKPVNKNLTSKRVRPEIKQSKPAVFKEVINKYRPKVVKKETIRRTPAVLKPGIKHFAPSMSKLKDFNRKDDSDRFEQKVKTDWCSSGNYEATTSVETKGDPQQIIDSNDLGCLSVLAEIPNMACKKTLVTNCGKSCDK